MNQYPEYEEDGQERLFFPNRWRSIEPQLITGADCFNPNAVLNNEENLIVLKLTAIEFTEIFSALYNGAVMSYPDRFMQILVNFLAGLHCPPILEEQDCFEYPSYASFMQYSPSNPYLQPDEIPEGYLAAPFLVNGENGVDVPNYEHFDILVPFDSLTLDVNWFEDIGGQLPQITVMVQGAGKAYLKMLCQVQGGLAVVTLDNPPNLLDILAGIITGADNIIDLNLDIVSLPPETATEIIYEVDVVGTGIHTIYIVFLPILDDSLIPLRFGGGFRGVQLCDFVEQPEMGIQDIRFDDVTCQLQTLIDGVWTEVSGWENWLDCVPSGGGGGGGGGGILPKVYDIVLGANVTTTSTSYVHASTLDQAHTFTKSKALIMAVFTAQNGGGQSSTFRQRMNTGTVVYGRDAIEGRTFGGAENREIVLTDVFEDIPLGSNTLGIEWKVSGNTGTIFDRYNVIWTIIEFDDASNLFVEDIRINGEELQKKIGGVWITVSDSLKTLLDAVQAAAAAAQTSANSAIATNTTQQTQINALQTGLGNANLAIDDLDDRITSIEDVDIPQINTTLANHESRIDALEAAGAGALAWETVYDFMSGDQGWTGNTWVNGSGFQCGAGVPLLLSKSSITVFDGRVTHAEFEFSTTVTGGLQNVIASFPHSSVDGNIRLSSGGFTTNWIKVPNLSFPYSPVISLPNPPSQTFYLRKIRILGRGSFNPFV